MDLSIAAKKIMPGCSIYNSPTLIKKNDFFEILINRIENSLQNSKYFPNYEDTRYGPFLHWLYEDSSNYVRSHKPNNLKPTQAEKFNILLNKLCFVQKTKTGQRPYFLALIDFLDSIEDLGATCNLFVSNTIKNQYEQYPLLIIYSDENRLYFVNKQFYNKTREAPENIKNLIKYKLKTLKKLV